MMENTWKTFGKFRKLLGFFGTPLAIIWGKVAAKINAPTVSGVIVSSLGVLEIGGMTGGVSGDDRGFERKMGNGEWLFLWVRTGVVIGFRG